MELKQRARKLLEKFKGNDYVFGSGALEQVGRLAAEVGRSALVIGNTAHLKSATDRLLASLDQNGVSVVGEKIIPGAGANTPREDVYRLESYLLHFNPAQVIAIGGGSTIDAAKAANVLATLGAADGEIDSYFGTGLVTAALKRSGKSLWPFLAVQTVSSSAAHLTKYSNVTDPVSGQKKLIVDDAITPERAVFDYDVTHSMSGDLTIDGALDGLSHCLEVFYGIGGEHYELAREITETALELILLHTPRAVQDPADLEAREALGLATDLGGYAIMIGGTNGAHLTSFSLVDISSHGRACGIMNPYYTVFFAPAIEKQLQAIGKIFQRTGLSKVSFEGLKGRELGTAVAKAMLSFGQSVGAPVSLAELPGFNENHLKRAIGAAKNPQLEMKLKNMPIPLTAALVDEYMTPLLQAAAIGDFSLIKTFR